MPDTPMLPWTEDQWAMLQRLVQDTARQARVASSFLPLEGPLPPGQAFVPKQELETDSTHPPRNRLSIDESETLPLITIDCMVYLKSSEVNDPNLASARQMLARAAIVLARLEDEIIFNGIRVSSDDTPDFPPADTLQGNNPPRRVFSVEPQIWKVTGSQKQGCPGLLSVVPVAGHIGERLLTIDRYKGTPDADYGSLVRSIASAIQKLEKRGQYGPFACVLGQILYLAAHTPTPNLVLASDRFVPFLGGGPFLRSAAVPNEWGVIVALSGAPVDLVVDHDMHVSYLQVNQESQHVLRVFEQFRLRIKQKDAILLLGVSSAVEALAQAYTERATSEGPGQSSATVVSTDTTTT